MSTNSDNTPSLSKAGKKGKKAAAKPGEPGGDVTSPPEKARGGKVTPLSLNTGATQVYPPVGGEKAGEPTSRGLFSPSDDQTPVRDKQSEKDTAVFVDCEDGEADEDGVDTSDSEGEGEPSGDIKLAAPSAKDEKTEPSKEAEKPAPPKMDSEIRRSLQADDAALEEMLEESRRRSYEKGKETKRRNKLREQENYREKQQLRDDLREERYWRQEAEYQAGRKDKELQLLKERIAALESARANDLSGPSIPSQVPSSNMESGVLSGGTPSGYPAPLLTHQPKVVVKPSQPIAVVSEFSWPKFLKLKEQLQLARANGGIAHRDDFISKQVMDKVRDAHKVFRRRRDLPWDEDELHELDDDDFFARMEQCMLQDHVGEVSKKRFDDVILQADRRMLSTFTGHSLDPVKEFMAGITRELERWQVEEPSADLVQQMARVLFDMIDIDPP